MENQPQRGLKRHPLVDGIPPSQQLKEAKIEYGGNMKYLPHVGAKQRAKEAKRAAKRKAKEEADGQGIT